MGSEIANSYEKAVRAFRAAILGVNISLLLLGIIYLFNQRGSVWWNAFGILMLSAFLGNIMLVYIEHRSNILAYIYLMLSSIAMLALPLINTAVSTNPSNHKSQSVVSFLIIFGLFFLGGLIAAKYFFGKLTEVKPKKALEETFRNIVVALLTIILLSGLIIVTSILKKDKSGILEVFVPEYALFYAIGYLNIGVLILKLLGKGRQSLRNVLLWIVIGIIFVVCMLPLASTPLLIKNAEQSYTKAFGADFRSNKDMKEGFFRSVPFSLPEYFFGTPSGAYNLQENVVYYKGSEGVDKGLVLAFDVYTPPKDGSELPGKNSVLIRIHGGGWTIGNKGSGNYAQINKYFASQGYVVFDVQYGLSNKHKLVEAYPVEATRVGNFSIDDMVRHIGIFTKYLADHKDEYGANLDSVFISGGSAGGQLISAVGLGIVNGSYSDILDPRLKIKGLIPFYPANGLPRKVELGGKKEFVDPEYLVSKNSPPTLIYQGDHDGMVDPAISDKYRNAYLEKGNSSCTVIKMPFGSHASDFYFSGYYSQAFLYYMERFMYQYR